jgi:hypothetical protein
MTAGKCSKCGGVMIEKRVNMDCFLGALISKM